MQIAILGCGWLGFPLALQLTEKYVVKGTTTTPGKLARLKDAGIIPHLIDLNDSKQEVITDFLSGSAVLIINIPPKIKAESALNYPEKIKQLVPLIVKSDIKKVLFVSSTSVYADDSSLPLITEKTSAAPETESGRQILAAEQALQAETKFATTILRFAGLIGNGRHPVFSLAGKKDLSNPYAPINLIGLEHCIDIIKAIIEENVWGSTFIAAEDYHPTREEYYTQMAQQYNLEPPDFNANSISVGKFIKGQEAVAKYLSYNGLLRV